MCSAKDMDHTVLPANYTMFAFVRKHKLQLDVRHHIQWRRHLVNANEGKAGMV